MPLLKGKLKLRTAPNTWEDRFFVLNKIEQTLCEHARRGVNPTRTISLTSVSLRQPPNGLKKHSFIISRPDRADIVLAADSEKTCSKWTTAINELHKQTVVTMMDLEKFKDPCIVFNSNFVAVDINRNAHNLFGFTQSECRDKPLSSILVDDEEMKQLVDSLTGATQTLHIGQYHAVRAKGKHSETLSLMMCINRLVEGDDTLFMVVFGMPIEQFDDFPAATLCSNAAGNIVGVNQKFLNMMGLTQTQLLPSHVPFAIPAFVAKQKGQTADQYIASRNLLGSPFKIITQRSNGAALSLIVWIGSWEEDGCVRYIATFTPSSQTRRRSSAFKLDQLKRGSDARASFSETLKTSLDRSCSPIRQQYHKQQHRLSSPLSSDPTSEALSRDTDGSPSPVALRRHKKQHRLSMPLSSLCTDPTSFHATVQEQPPTDPALQRHKKQYRLSAPLSSLCADPASFHATIPAQAPTDHNCALALQTNKKQNRLSAPPSSLCADADSVHTNVSADTKQQEHATGLEPSDSSLSDRFGSTSEGEADACAGEDFSPRDKGDESLATIYSCLMKLKAAVPALENELSRAREQQKHQFSKHNPPTSWEFVWQNASTMEADVGDIIMEAGEPTTALFRVKQGQIAISAEKGPVLKQLGPGSIIGKQIVFDSDSPARLTAVVTEGTEIEALSVEQIEEIFEQQPQVALLMMRDLGRDAMSLVREVALMVDPLMTPRLCYIK